MRCIRIPESVLLPLSKCIDDIFIPSIFSEDVNVKISGLTREILELPCRLGGLAIPDPSKEAALSFSAATSANRSLIESLISGDYRKKDSPYNKQKHHIQKAKAKQQKEAQVKQISERIKKDLRDCKSVEWAKIVLKLLEMNSQNGASSALAVIPLAQYGFTLNSMEFRDLLSVRFNLPIRNLPQTCACGNKNSMQHASSCRMGGFRTRQHNQTVTLWGELLCAAGATNLRNEMIIRAKNNDSDPAVSPLIRSDIAVDDGNSNTTHFDVTLVNPIAPSHITKPVASAFKNAEHQKNRKYKQVIKENLKQNFSPLVHNSITGLPQLAANQLFKDLVQDIANNTDQLYCDVMISYRIRLAIAAARTMSQNLRGNRRKPRRLFQLSQPHNYTETLIAWKLQNYGGDSWSEGISDYICYK